VTSLSAPTRAFPITGYNHPTTGSVLLVAIGGDDCLRYAMGEWQGGGGSCIGNRGMEWVSNLCGCIL
jgi:hypothetical protein